MLGKMPHPLAWKSVARGDNRRLAIVEERSLPVHGFVVNHDVNYVVPKRQSQDFVCLVVRFLMVDGQSLGPTRTQVSPLLQQSEDGLDEDGLDVRLGLENGRSSCENHDKDSGHV